MTTVITKWAAGALTLGLSATAGGQSLGDFSSQTASFFEPWAASTLAQAEAEGATDEGFTVFADNGEEYSGAQGLISLQGTRGTFLNPTSGTLGQGQFTIQYCILLADQEAPNSDITGHGILGSYGVTDWLEVGFFYNAAEVRALDEIIAVAGPTVRARVLKETDVMPEVSIGGLWFDGDRTSDALSRQEAYVVASKNFEIDEDGFVQAFRVHGGVRQAWRHDAPAAAVDNGTVGHVGGELFMPYGFSLIAEVNSQDDFFGPRTPFALGGQWKPVGGILGLSVAHVQNGGLNRPAVYIGIGGVFEF
ncbi:MAG: hypothetical protein AAGA25_10575 [Planctomycetota bacterium]